MFGQTSVGGGEALQTSPLLPNPESLPPLPPPWFWPQLPPASPLWAQVNVPSPLSTACVLGGHGLLLPFPFPLAAAAVLGAAVPLSAAADKVDWGALATACVVCPDAVPSEVPLTADVPEAAAAHIAHVAAMTVKAKSDRYAPLRRARRLGPEKPSNENRLNIPPPPAAV